MPDGTSLTAKAIDDENFPAINIYWDGAESESYEEVALLSTIPNAAPATRSVSEFISQVETTQLITSHIWQKGM